MAREAVDPTAILDIASRISDSRIAVALLGAFAWSGERREALMNAAVMSHDPALLERTEQAVGP
jgi:hypothetical protein